LDFFQTFESYITNHNLFQKNDKLLLAVSGGVDSVVLCDCMHKAGYDFVIAHCNFQLRGDESLKDELFVKELGIRYGVEVKTIRFDIEKDAVEKNIQASARHLRYKWFEEIIQQSNDNPIKAVVTAHHANDNIETVIMNFIKGTGINGLQGMRPQEGGISGIVIRPLLFAKKEEVLAYATANNLVWREDQSNQSSKYSRNFIRNEIVPLLKTKYTSVEDNILSNIQRFNQIGLIYNQALQKEIASLVEKRNNEIFIPILKLLKSKVSETLIHEIIIPFNFTAHQIQEVIKLLNAGSGKFIDSSSHRILNNRNWLIISLLNNSTNNQIVIEKHQQEIFFNNHKIYIESLGVKPVIDVDLSIALLDSKDIHFPLIIRKWKTGDYFYPLGMSKKKKLSRFFIDSKLSKIEKEKVWVIESKQRIIWVVGMRIDNRFKLTERTDKILKLTLISSK